MGIIAYKSGMLEFVIGCVARSDSKRVITNSEISISPICLFPIHLKIIKTKMKTIIVRKNILAKDLTSFS